MCKVMAALENDTDLAPTFSAGCALAAALMFVEFNQAGDGSDNVSLQKRMHPPM